MFPKNATRKQIPALLNQVDEDGIFRRGVENLTEFAIGAVGGFQVALAFRIDHLLQQRAHLIDRLIGDLRRTQSGGLGLEQGANPIDVSQAVKIELGDAHTAMAFLNQDAARQKLEHRLPDRRRADAEILHQLKLPQRLAGRVVPEADRVLQLVERDLALGAKDRGLGLLGHAALLYFVFCKI